MFQYHGKFRISGLIKKDKRKKGRKERRRQEDQEMALLFNKLYWVAPALGEGDFHQEEEKSLQKGTA